MSTGSPRVLYAVLGLMCALLLREGCLTASDSARRASCRPNIVLTTCNEYARAHGGIFPPLSPVPGMLTYDPSICKDTPCFWGDNVCEYDVQGENDRAFRKWMFDHPINDWSFVYIGYAIENEEQMLAFFKAYRNSIEQRRMFDSPLDVGGGNGTDGASALRRLQSVESLLANKDPMALRAERIPVVIEWPENHRYPGGHVVYLDGHREFVSYPGKFPMTTTIITELRALDNFAP